MFKRPSTVRSALAALLLLGFAGVTFAEGSTAELIENARKRAREIQEIKQVLADPDQTVRLAAFDAMVGSGNATQREMALDAGLASTDSVLRNLAFKHALLGQDQISITLIVDTEASKVVQEKSVERIDRHGGNWVAIIDPKTVDLVAGKFNHPGNSSMKGGVSGPQMTLKYGDVGAEMRLQDDNTLVGKVFIDGAQFKAKAAFR